MNFSFIKFRKIPLAWLLLTRQPLRLIVAIAGISFAGILMFMQLGFRDGLFDTSVTIHKLLDADIVLISPRSKSSISMSGFPKRRLIQTLALDEVERTAPVNLNYLLWRNPESLKTRSILALGFNPSDSLLLNDRFSEKAQKLKNPGRVLFDKLSRPEFGPIEKWFTSDQKVETEVAGKRVIVEGLVELGPSFGADGNLITSRETFLRLFPANPQGSIEIGLVKLKDGSNADYISNVLNNSLPNDVRVLTKDQFIEFEKNYWKNSTAIGFIFSLGALMGFVVGCVVVYQILYSDVTDHLPEYATLLAMGYRLKSLFFVVAREGFLLALFGYLPAYISGQILYSVIRDSTKLPIVMDFEKSFLIFILVLIMCMGSAGIAMRKLVDADPAEIF
ncbi:ABC transporter permease DevC [Prochlorococcus sp. AH-736-K09]|nr:ABC transporter permease DevC [Prochlorococcus sp. AH-736-K09]